MSMSGIRTLHRRPLWVGYGVAVLATALAVPAYLLLQLLRSLNHEVKVADSVATALALGANSDFDLIISDLGLPDGSGLELMPRLKAQHDLPGIALSGYGTEDDIRKSRGAGFGEHLTKPIGLHALEAAIARATKQTRAVAP